jgi:hypothetical protein
MPRSLWKRWQEYFAAEPWGGLQDDLRAAYVTCLTYNAHRGKDDPAREPWHWFPSLRVFKAPPRERTEQDARIEIAQWKAFVLARGGKEIKSPAKGKV